MDMPEVLTKKIGPLPAGVWLVAIVGGVGVAIFVRRGATDTAAVDEAYAAGEQAGADSIAGGSGWQQGGNTATNPGAGGGGYMDWYDGGGGADDAEDDTDTAPPADDDTPGELPPDQEPSTVDHVTLARRARTNGGWITHATAALVDRGYRAGTVGAAFRNWWAGKPMNAAQQAAVSAAVALCGAPPKPPTKRVDVNGTAPGGHLPSSPKPKPAPKPKPKPEPKPAPKPKRKRNPIRRRKGK